MSNRLLQPTVEELESFDGYQLLRDGKISAFIWCHDVPEDLSNEFNAEQLSNGLYVLTITDQGARANATPYQTGMAIGLIGGQKFPTVSAGETAIIIRTMWPYVIDIGEENWAVDIPCIEGIFCWHFLFYGY